jgi:hypothetical protein
VPHRSSRKHWEEVLRGRVEISKPVKAAAATSPIVKGMLLVIRKPPGYSRSLFV